MVKGPQLATPWNCSFSQSEPQSKGKFVVHSQILSYGRRTTLQKNGLDPRLQPWLRAGSSRYVGEFSHDYTDEKFFSHTVEDSLNSRSQTLSLGNNVSQSNWFFFITIIFLTEDLMQLWSGVGTKQTESIYKSFLSRRSSKQYPHRDTVQAAFVHIFIPKQQDALPL